MKIALIIVLLSVVIVSAEPFVGHDATRAFEATKQWCEDVLSACATVFAEPSTYEREDVDYCMRTLKSCDITSRLYTTLQELNPADEDTAQLYFCRSIVEMSELDAEDEFLVQMIDVCRGKKLI